MAPYSDKKHGTTNSGFRHPDPLEVTRTTSNNSMSSAPDSPTNSRLSAAAAVLECDYDTNPTVLYQAIEAKQWDYAISLFTKRGANKFNDEEDDEEDASATWVVRKESNGKLRWRLLPLHAAVIFGSPLKLVELLLADYPLAAQCKDDRGMLPLHLAFRKQASWDVIDELLTTYPMAVFVSDRKGRIPLKCGVSQSLSKQNTNDNHNTTNTVSSVTGTNGALMGGSAFRTAAGVLELYSQIVISGERKRVEQETRALAQTSISQMLDSHLRQTEALRKKADSDKADADKRIGELERENKDLQERLSKLEQELAERDQSHLNMTKKLRLTNVKLNLANERAEAHSNDSDSSNANQTSMNNKSIDKFLRMMADTMVRQQKAYHGHVRELLTNYQELVAERETMRSIFLKESSAHQQKEAIMLESFQNWFREEDKKLSIQERSLLLSPPPSSVDCSATSQKQITVETKDSLSASHDDIVRNKTSETTKRTTTVTPIVEEKVQPDPVPTISSGGINSTSTISVPSVDSDEEERSSKKEPRDAPM